MWGADGAVIPTVKDGNVTLFIVAEHWNAEGLGWHVAKQGNRYAAAAALALAVSRVFGSVRADAARGVSVRHDHGSPFMSAYFQNQLKFFGMAPSFASVHEPETNGVAERFIRTLKEQIVFGRIYQADRPACRSSPACGRRRSARPPIRPHGGGAMRRQIFARRGTARRRRCRRPPVSTNAGRDSRCTRHRP
jgi:transposase InsO family protein